ncbi:MAG: Response regulator receiver protein [Parcubacteria group bacterium GW2011_GWB1_45_9]|nr:MAG: Response regulator receiver protein [Parcubacteria group bacterium GW2011_GWB1_45_9]
MKILIVEDEAVLSKVLKEKFERSGFECIVASDGEVAITMARDGKPDVIVLDLVLPKKNGFLVLEEIKEDAGMKLIPIVVVSNLGEDGDIKKALALGAADYFVKSQHPINEIVEKVKSVLTEIK